MMASFLVTSGFNNPLKTMALARWLNQNQFDLKALSREILTLSIYVRK